jgi:hypothetical protein
MHVTHNLIPDAQSGLVTPYKRSSLQIVKQLNIFQSL